MPDSNWGAGVRKCIKELYLAQYAFNFRTAAWESENLKSASAILMVTLPQFWVCCCLVCVLEVIRGSRFLLLKEHTWIAAFLVPALYQLNSTILIKTRLGPNFITQFNNFSPRHRRILSLLSIAILLVSFGLGLIVVPWRDRLVPYH